MRRLTVVRPNKNVRIAIGGLIVAVVIAMLAMVPLRTDIVHAQTSVCVTNGAVPSGNAALAADCETLLGMKSALRGSGKLNWWAGRSIQRWDGVTVESGRVVGVSLPGKSLNGVLPAAFGNLSGLQSLDLSGNSLTGTIPTELGNLTLVKLRLAGNSFTGCVPASLLDVPDSDAASLNLPVCGGDGEPTPIPITTPTPTPSESLSEMVKRVRPAVVKISASGWLPYARGTGFIFSTVPDAGGAYILTNFHVIEEAGGLAVKVNDTEWYTPTVTFRDARRDIAVLYICCDDFVSVGFADSNTLFAGDEVVAIGYQQDYFMPRTLRPGRIIVPGEASVTRGMISAFRYDSRMDAQLVQTDAALNTGNSGSPIFTTDGRVVALHYGGLDHTKAEQVSFSILETTVQEKLRIWTEGPEAEFGPENGELPHEVDEYIERWSPDFEATDDEFALRATFVNPYDATDTDEWDYGFRFGHTDDPDDPYMYFVVDSRKQWYLSVRKADGNLEEILRGGVPQLLREAGERNSLSVLVDGKYGALYVNGLRVYLNNEPVSRYVDLGGDLVQSHGGSVDIVTGYFTGDERAGAVTAYEDFYGVSYSHD